MKKLDLAEKLNISIVLLIQSDSFLNCKLIGIRKEKIYYFTVLITTKDPSP